MQIYAVHINKPLSDDEFHCMTQISSVSTQKKIKKYKFRKDMERTLIGEILVRHIIKKQFGISNNAIHFSTNSYGKPYAIDFEDFNYNISHSGSWVVLAVDDSPIGVDIEKIQPIDLDVAKLFFSKKEYTNLMNTHISLRTSYFYQLWSMKESYVKQVGKGLTIPLNSFSIQLNSKKGPTIDVPKTQPTVFLKTYPIHINYRMAVCATNPHFPKEIIIKNYTDLFEFKEVGT
ncbi:4'-phosphopantetheinyl transferase [Bacillus anthracis]|nr:4'-phosphopantetheinyl transferase [Bacillus anthracis]